MGRRAKKQGPAPQGPGDWRWIYEAAGALGWSISDALGATLPEIQLALQGKAIAKYGRQAVRSSAVMSRGALDALMARYPDAPKPSSEDK